MSTHQKQVELANQAYIHRQERDIDKLKLQVAQMESNAYFTSRRIDWVNSLAPRDRETYHNISFESLWSRLVDMRRELAISQSEVYYLKEHIRPTIRR